MTPKTVSNFIIGQIFRRLSTDAEKENADISVPAVNLRELVALIDSGKLRMNLAKSTLEKMLDTGKPVSELVSEEDMKGVDDSALLELCRQAVADNPGRGGGLQGGQGKGAEGHPWRGNEGHPRQSGRGNGGKNIAGVVKIKAVGAQRIGRLRKS